MVKSCCAYGCTNRQNKIGISFHRFPNEKTDPVRRKQWILATKRENFTPGPSTYICSVHFRPDDFYPVYASGKTSLRENSVPSVFDFPKHLQKPVVKKKKASVSSSQNEEQMVITPDLALVKEETTDDERAHNIQINNDLIKRTIASLEKPKDEYTSFGEFVAHELRCINATSLRQKLKRMIQQAILEIAEEDENCTD